MKIEIEQITLKKRIRKNLGDLSQLMQSLKEHGLMNPIVVTGKFELIAGHRRLESAKRLGWDEIDATILHDLDEIQKLEMEIEENLHRRSLSPDELAEGYARLSKLKNPGFLRKLWNKIKAFFAKLFKRRK